MKIRMFLFTALIAVLVAGGFTQNAFAKGGSGGGGGASKTRITLTASANYPKAKGKATYKAKASEREFQVEVENLKSLKGKTVTIFVNGSAAGSATVDSLGAARLNLNTELGNTVPNIKSGDTVQVKNASGVLIVSGTF